jgi:hypothetical protein
VNLVDVVFAYRLLLDRVPAPGPQLSDLLSAVGTGRSLLGQLLSSRAHSSPMTLLPAGLRLMTEANGFRLWFDSMIARWVNRWPPVLASGGPSSCSKD